MSSVNKVISAIIILVTIYYSIQYCITYVPMPVLDSFHYGEKFGAYYLHAKQGMKYFIDIMLMHGYIDVLPSQIADKFLGGLTFYNERIAVSITSIVFMLASVTIAAFLFKKQWVNIIMISGLPIFLLKISTNPWTCYLYLYFLFLAYILLLEKYEKFNNLVWNFVFYIIFLFAIVYQSTYSLAFAIGMLPLLFKRIKDYPKFCIPFYIIAAIITLCLFGDYLIPYLHSMTYYVKSATIVFANKFPDKIQMFDFTISCSGLILCPVFINLIFTDKKFEIRYVCYLMLIFLILLLSYAFAKIDNSLLVRYRAASILVLSSVIPYLLIKTKSKYLSIYYAIILFVFIQIPVWWNNVNEINSFHSSRSDFIRKNIPEDAYLMDLTDDNMIFYISKRKTAMPYVYSNIINTKQQKDILKNMREKSKLYILVGPHWMNLAEHTNEIYRWLFFEDNYKVIKDNNDIYFFYDNSGANYRNEKKELDWMISQRWIEYLPDAWGASVKTLPMSPVEANIKINDNTISIETVVTPNEANLLYIEYEGNGETNFELTMGGSDSPYWFKSKKNKILLPIDYYPSWLLADKIQYFYLKPDKTIKIKKAKLYKRN